MEARTPAAYQPAIVQCVEASGTTARTQFEELITAGVAAGEWPPETDPPVEARLVTATVQGLMAQWHLHPGAFSWDAAATALVRA